MVRLCVQDQGRVYLILTFLLLVTVVCEVVVVTGLELGNK